jgi:hypothetical protein
MCLHHSLNVYVKITQCSSKRTRSFRLSKGEDCPVHIIEEHRWGTCILPLIFMLGTVRRLLVRYTLRTLCLQERTPVPSEWKVGWAPDPRLDDFGLENFSCLFRYSSLGPPRYKLVATVYKLSWPLSELVTL